MPATNSSSEQLASTIPGKVDDATDEQKRTEGRWRNTLLKKEYGGKDVKLDTTTTVSLFPAFRKEGQGGLPPTLIASRLVLEPCCGGRKRLASASRERD